MPEPPGADENHPTEIPIGPQPVLEITAPWGIDTYFLLTTSEPIPDPFVLDSEGVLGPDLSRGHPLERLLRNRGVSKRGKSLLTPTTWSIDRVSYEILRE
ncbi:MAG: hypothetical protein GY856_26250 [bacterium]|nr:hypothetical protein [bacterium]